MRGCSRVFSTAWVSWCYVVTIGGGRGGNLVVISSGKGEEDSSREYEEKENAHCRGTDGL